MKKYVVPFLMLENQILSKLCDNFDLSGFADIYQNGRKHFKMSVLPKTDWIFHISYPGLFDHSRNYWFSNKQH